MQTTDSVTVLSAYTVSSEKIGFGFHTWVISRWGIGPGSLSHAPDDLLQEPLERSRFWHSKAIHYPPHIILTSPSCRFSYYILLQKKMVLPSKSHHMDPGFITDPGMSIY